MVEPQEVEFLITPDGNVEFTIKGAPGTQCVPIAELFKVLGTTQFDRPTPEYYEEDSEAEVTLQGHDG